MTLLRDVTRWLLHRGDAWAVTLVICLLAQVLHDEVTGWGVALSLAVAAMYLFGYAVNDYFDADDDADDPAKVGLNVFVDHPVSKRAFMVGVLVTIAAVVAVMARWGLRGLGAFALYFVVMWSYSSPPFRFKHVPGLDLAMHAAFALTYPYAVCLWLLDLDVGARDVLILVLLFLFSLSGQLEQQLRDLEADALTGRTFATAVGRRVATSVLRMSMVGVVVVAVVALVAVDIPWGVLPAVILTLPTIAFRLGVWRVESRPAVLVRALVVGALVYGVAVVSWAAASGGGWA